MSKCDDPDHMEMPVQCVCKKWMELNDSRLPPGKNEGETVCDECYYEMLDDYDDNRAMDVW